MSCKQRSAQRNARRGRLKGIAGLRAQPGGCWLTYSWWAWPRFDYAKVEARILASLPLQQPGRIYPRKNTPGYLSMMYGVSGKTDFVSLAEAHKNFPANTVKN